MNIQAWTVAFNQVKNGTKAQRLYLCERDFSLFFAYYFVNYLKYPFASFHWDMFDDLKDLEEGRVRELVWMMFRESAKTSFAEGFVTWCICFLKRKYINVDSVSKTNSERILYSVINNLQANNLIIQDFGHLYNETRDPNLSTVKRQMDFLANENRVRVEAHTTATDVRGRKHIEQRPDLLIMDDFETSETKKSVAETKSVIAHIDEFKSGLGPNAWVIYLCNYITEYGSVQTLLDRAKEDDRLRVRNVPVLGPDGKPTWPGKYVLTDAEAQGTGKVSIEDRKKQLGSIVFSAEMMNNPVDEDTSPFKKDFFVPIPFEDVKKKRTACFVTIDTPSVKEGEVNPEGDYCGFCVNWVDTDNYWNLKAWRERLGPYALITKIIDLYSSLVEAGTPPETFAWEDTAYTRGLEVGLREEMRKRRVFFSITWLKHGGRAKDDRVRTGLLSRYESRANRHIEGECVDLERELLRFPNSLHDDCSDATAYQADIAHAPFAIIDKSYEGQNPFRVNTAPKEVEEYEPQYSEIGI